MSDVLVVGCGLLGTSIGLALRGSAWGDVTLADRDRAHQEIAVSRGAGRAWDGREPAKLAVVATPPRHVAVVLSELQRLDVARTYTHVSSVQSHVQQEVEALNSRTSRVVGGHPLAGREVSGPAAALADLFVGRPWAVCASSAAEPDAIEDVMLLATTCGAVPIRSSPQEHDEVVALLSHLPQVLSSGLAGLLAPGAREVEGLSLALSGPGLVDTTRLAAGDADLWTDILMSNASRVAPHVRHVAAELDALAAALESAAHGGALPAPEAGGAANVGRLGGPVGGPVGGAVGGAVGGGATGNAGAGRSSVEGAEADTVVAQHGGTPAEVVEHFLRRGNAGRARVPVKRGELAAAFAAVRVELEDRPGQLAALLTDAGAAGVNVEDVHVEHVPGRARGVVELLVAPGAEVELQQALQHAGWLVFSSL